MKIKIISVLLACFMIIGNGTAFAVIENNSLNELSQNDKKVIDFIDKMGFSGVLSGQEPKLEQKITRAEFAALLTEICGFGVANKSENYFKELFSENDKDDVLITDETLEKNHFDDVSQGHWAYSYIESVKERGLMIGTSNTQFSPDEHITVTEAVKPILKALNYSAYVEMRGGYPVGCLKTADELKLLKNINKNNDEELDWLSAQHLMYNALHTVCFKQVGYGTTDIFSDKDGEMLLTKVFGIEAIKGIITDNGISSLTGSSEVGQRIIKIEDLSLNITESTDYVTDYLGHMTVVYYFNDECENAFDIKYATISEKEEIIEILPQDFVEIEGNVIKYYIKDKLKRGNLVEVPYVIVNGEAISEYDSSLFDFDDGLMTLISWDGGKFSVIIINKTEYCFVSQINDENGIIYNKLITSDENNLNIINLKDYEFVNIINEEGEKLSVSNIQVEDVLEIVRGKNIISLKVVRKKIDDVKVKSVSSLIDGKKTISSENAEYKVIEKFFNSVGASDIDIQKTYRLYLNSRGEVVWADINVGAGSKSAAILTKCGIIDETGENEYYIKVYAGNEKFDRYFLKEKIILNGKRIKTEDNIEYINSHKSALILFKLNEENMVTEITTPADYGDRSDRGLYRLNVAGIESSYSGSAMTFSTRFFLGSGCVTYTIPPDVENLDDISTFQYNKASFVDQGKYMIEAYATEVDNKGAKYIVVKNQVSSGVVKTDAIVIESVLEALDLNDVPCIKITGYGCDRINDQVAKLKEFVVEADAVIINEGGTKVSDFSVEDLKPGDIIRFGLNARGNIETINVAYDLSKDTISHIKNEKGEFPLQTIYGYAYSTYPGILTVARNIRPDLIDFSNGAAAQNSLLVYKAPNTRIVTVDTTRRNPKIALGTFDDIVSYTKTMSSNGCSKIVALSEWTAHAYLIVVYN